MIFHSGKFGAASAWFPLLFDTLVLILTLYVTVPSIRRNTPGNIVRTIFRDGLLYYAYALSRYLAPGIRYMTARIL